ncbi:hypothetical protein V6N13_010591 [Hibiscus sabdariffa]|uniref:Uncharacterized protein n=2 Tax=Hibiscus sabdariffa TaxID=183260 RepID=A0ABR2AYJ9_9ROSI
MFQRIVGLFVRVFCHHRRQQRFQREESLLSNAEAGTGLFRGKTTAIISSAPYKKRCQETRGASILVVTYEGEHRHSQPAMEENMAPAVGMLIESTS